MRTPWKRIGTSLAIGVVLTVAAAWSGELLDGVSSVTAGREIDERTGVAEQLWTSMPQFGELEWRHMPPYVDDSILLTRHTASGWAEMKGGGVKDVVVNQVTVGFPFRCLQRRHWIYDPFSPKARSVVHEGVVRLPSRQLSIGDWRLTTPPRLAAQPLTWGFLLNTCIYGAMVFGLGAFGRSIRSWRRVRAGRCRQCGYDNRGVGQGRCPECGFAGKPLTGQQTPNPG